MLSVYGSKIGMHLSQQQLAAGKIMKCLHRKGASEGERERERETERERERERETVHAIYCCVSLDDTYHQCIYVVVACTHCSIATCFSAGQLRVAVRAARAEHLLQGSSGLATNSFLYYIRT